MGGQITKQSQFFCKKANESASVSKKQTQFKANQTHFKRIQSHFKPTGEGSSRTGNQSNPASPKG